MLIRYTALALASIVLTLTAWAETTYVVDITLRERADVDAFTAAGYLVGNVDGDVATLYLTGPQLWDLEAAGTPYTVVEIQDGAVSKGVNKGTGFGQYVSYATLTAILQDYAANNPDICRLTSIGKSVQNRDLWVFRITDNPDEEEAEPEFKYVATIHGDEPIGTVNLLYLIELMTGSYGTNNRITTLINETDISFLVLMNPDGYEAVVRANANSKDLNRSFPQGEVDFTGTVFDGTALGDVGRQPEVAAVMNWSAANSFVLSANFHSGALVVNYPYDYIPGVPSGSAAIAPDNGLLIDLSLAYSKPNSPMYFNASFPSGITNGSAWYVAIGGMQDWNYRYLGTIETTIELSNTKRPAEANLPGLWANNQESMLAYMEYVHRGLRGVITETVGGAPVYAQVTLAGNTQPVFSDPDVGDYYRLLMPGTYTVTFSSPGLSPKTVAGVSVVDGPATILDVTLDPRPEDISFDGVVDAVDIQLVINAALGMTITGDADVNASGSVDAVDIQTVINAALL